MVEIHEVEAAQLMGLCAAVQVSLTEDSEGLSSCSVRRLRHPSLVQEEYGLEFRSSCL